MENIIEDFYEEKFKKPEETINEERKRRAVQENEENEADISQGEVEKAIKSIKNGKACGWDDIAPKYIKYGGPKLTEVLTEIYQNAWKEEKIPEEWKKNVIIPLHKKGSKTDCENYRAICLSPIALKIYTKILENRLRNVIEPDMEEEQCAFRPGRQTHIFNKNNHREINRKKQRTIHWIPRPKSCIRHSATPGHMECIREEKKSREN